MNMNENKITWTDVLIVSGLAIIFIIVILENAGR